MKNGLLRNIRLVWYNFTVHGLQLLMAIPVLIIYFALIQVNLPLGGITALFSLITPLFMSLTGITVIYKNAMGFSSTKRNFYIASFFHKFLYVFFFGIATFILSILSGFYPFNSLGGMALLFALSMTLGALGDFYGLLILRSQKSGFIIYMISFCGITFSAVGIFVYFTLKNPNDNITELLYSSLSVPLTFAGIAAVFAALTAINWRMLRKTEIRS